MYSSDTSRDIAAMNFFLITQNNHFCYQTESIENYIISLSFQRERLGQNNCDFVIHL